MTSAFPPILIFLLGSLLIPALRGRARSAYMLLLPVIGFVNLLCFSEGYRLVVPFLQYDLVVIHADRLSLVFGYIFHMAAFITILYMLNGKGSLEYMAGFVYAGAALGVVFAGDLVTFFVCWELLTLPAVYLVLCGKRKGSMGAGIRYLLMHVSGGLVLLLGIILKVHETGSIAIEVFALDSLSSLLIFIGMGVNAAWPLLHTWLVDSYPEAGIGGAVFLSAFTTKTAVYALARTFPGAEPLIWIGGLMVSLPVFFAVIENDLRRVLSYSLINQVGYMMVGIGIGTQMSLNGTAAHAFCHIIYKALLFMSVGAVIYRTGKSRATDLGGIYKSMPLTCMFCIIGAASISAFPLFSGFVSKSLIVTAAADGHMILIWFVLLFASAGVFHHAGIKIPFFTFFGHDSGLRVKEAPWPMLLAMGIASLLCLVIGIFPKETLYPILPYAVDYEPYTVLHVMGQSKLLFFSALAFTLLVLSGIYPSEIRSVNLDADWLFRKGCGLFLRTADRVCNGLNAACDRFFSSFLAELLALFFVNAPGRILQAVMTPVWIFEGLNKKQRKERSLVFYDLLMRNAFPIGITCGLSVIFVAVLLLI